MPKPTQSLVVAASATLALCLSSCAGEEPGDSAWKDEEANYEIDGFDWGRVEETDRDSDGKNDWKQTVQVKVGGVLREIELEAEYDEATGDQSLWVYDTEADNLRVYSFWPELNALWFADADDTTAELTLMKNPDGTYFVGDTEVPDVKAALALMKQNPIWESASTWGFMLTYSLCQSCLQSALGRIPQTCIGGGVSRPPAICDVFHDFCECAKCDKAGLTSCSTCP